MPAGTPVTCSKVNRPCFLLGMSMTFMLRHRRLWVRITPVDGGSRLQLASAEKLDTTFERHFRGLVERIDATAPENSPSTDEKELIDA